METIDSTLTCRSCLLPPALPRPFPEIRKRLEWCGNATGSSPSLVAAAGELIWPFVRIPSLSSSQSPVARRPFFGSLPSSHNSKPSRLFAISIIPTSLSSSSPRRLDRPCTLVQPAPPNARSRRTTAPMPWASAPVTVLRAYISTPTHFSASLKYR